MLQVHQDLHVVLGRSSKLSELESRADELTKLSHQFKTSADKIKLKIWWQNCKVSLEETSEFSDFFTPVLVSLALFICECYGLDMSKKPFKIRFTGDSQTNFAVISLNNSF